MFRESVWHIKNQEEQKEILKYCKFFGCARINYELTQSSLFSAKYSHDKNNSTAVKSN